MGFFKGLKKLGAVFFFIADVFFFIADAPDHIRAYMAAHFCGYAKNTLSSCHDHSVDTEMPSKNVVDRLMKYAGYRKLGARIGHTSASAMPFKSLWEDPTFANLFRTLPTLLHCSLLVLFGLLEMMTVCFRWILFILIVGGFFVLGFVLGLVLLVMALAGLMEGAGAKGRDCAGRETRAVEKMESEDAGWEFEIEGELELEDAGQGSDIKEDAVQRLPYVVTCSIAGDAKDDSVEKKLKAKASAVEEGKKRLEGFRVMESEELRELAVLQREFEDHFVEDADLAAIQRQIEDAERAMSAARRRRARLCIPNPKTQPELLETTPF